MNNSSFDDLFGPIVSAPNPVVNNVSSTFPQQTSNKNNNKNEGTNLYFYKNYIILECKKSSTDILALFANIRPPVTNSTMLPQQSAFQLNQSNF